MMHRLKPIPLEPRAFAPFGVVLDRTLAESFPINKGTVIRYHRLAEVEAAPPEACVILSIFSATNRGYPFPVEMMERHPLGSQAFFPLTDDPWLVVVAADAGGVPDSGQMTCFLASGRQGVQYHRNIWHHPLLILAERQDFFIVDRDGGGTNLEEYAFDAPVAEITPDQAAYGG